VEQLRGVTAALKAMKKQDHKMETVDMRMVVASLGAPGSNTSP
jgi:hypothetical protein